MHKHPSNFKHNQLPISIEDLTVPTQKRFLELELRLLQQKTNLLFRGTYAHKTDHFLMDMLDIHQPATRQDILNTLQSFSFRNPNQTELIDMLRYHQIPYAHIQRLARVSPNTIARRRFYVPELSPIYPDWTAEHRSLLTHIRKVINYFS